MTKEQIENKIKEILNVRTQAQQTLANAQQQLIACSGALQVLEELLKSEEKEKTEDETVKD